LPYNHRRWQRVQIQKTFCRSSFIEGETGMSMRVLAFLSIVIILTGFGESAGAATFRVPLDYADMQTAMAAAGEGDTVLVAPGTYAGAANRTLDFGGINMVIISEAGPETTIIDCEGAGRAFSFQSGEDSTCVIHGFTITNATGGNGGAIELYEAAGTIENCIFAGNTATMNGGGIYCGYSSTRAYIRNCVFYGNTARWRGGGIECDHGYGSNVPPVISDCVFYDNTAGTGGDFGGGAIFTNYSPALVTGCTVVGNAGGPGAGGLMSESFQMTARNCIIAFNTGSAGVHNVYVEKCLLYFNEGTDSIDPAEPEIIELDPLFCNLATRDLTLCGDSSCLPGAVNNPWGEAIGAYGAGCGDCGMGTEESSWGSIKRRVRTQ
jgi:predicted outer membrane repeat protein